MATIPNREIEDSPLGGSIECADCTVQVHIYRFAETDDKWTLEVVDHEGASTVWDETFTSDHDAYEAFEQAVVKHGIRSFAEDEPVRH